MLGATGGRFLGPSGSQPHRNLWPPPTGRTLDFQSNGEVTESLFAAGGYNTPPASSPFMSVSPLELVAKNFHSGAVAFSQANSILVQSHTDFLSGTSVAKKTETCIGRWEHGNLEPLQIHVPPLTSVSNLSIKSENISTGSSRVSPSEVVTSHAYHHHTDLNSGGCSRTIPISWTPHSTTTNLNDNCGGSHNGSLSLVQIKREPCQVSEVTTSNGVGPHSSLTAVVKIESQSQSSPKSTMMDHGATNGGQNSIPVGIAVARQRLQDHSNFQQQQLKDANRFGIGITDIGGVAPALSQNMFFTGTNSTMIPLTSEALTMGVSNVQNAVRTPPTLWQYPTAPVSMESMLPMPIPPPVGFQLVRDPATGQFLFLPTLDKMYISYLEPVQQAVVWPTYPQASIQPQHLLLPPMTQQMQPPPLAPLQLLGSDYLTTASTTLHQHTQTHSTRLVALTETTKCRKQQSNATQIPLPLPSHTATLFKIDDSNTSSGSGGTTAHLFEQEKSTIQTATIATAVQTNEIPPNLAAHLYYQHPGNLIQIAPHPNSGTMCDTLPLDCHRSNSNITPPIQVPAETSACLTPPPEQPNIDSSIAHESTANNQQQPEVQDANIQTDSPIMSEDDNTNGPDDCSMPSTECNEDNQEMMCHNVVDSSSIPSSTVADPIDENHLSSNSIEQHNERVMTNPEDRIRTPTPPSALAQATAAQSTPPPLAMMESNYPTTPNLQIIQQERVDTKFFGKCDVIKINIPLPTTMVKNEQLTPHSPTFPPPPREDPFNELEPTSSTQPISVREQAPVEQPVDLSGLQLLSNSIEAFEKKTFIKQEPIDEEIIENQQQTILMDIPTPSTSEPQSSASKTNLENEGELEGLNLLCALAEQRFNEEIDQRNKILSCGEVSPNADAKRRKHKHSKANKKSKQEKELQRANRDRKRKHRSGDEEDNDDQMLGTELKETLNRVKTKYPKCICSKVERDDRCNHERCNWPTPAEIFSTLETDMKMRLADITRQCEEKKRELNEISPLLKTLQSQKSTDDKTLIFGGISSSVIPPFPVNKPNTSATTTTTAIPIVSPNFSISSHSESNLIELPKLSSDTDSCRFDDFETNSMEKMISKRKLGTPRKCDTDSNLTETIFAKKPKSLVGYILASKNRANEANVKDDSNSLPPSMVSTPTPTPPLQPPVISVKQPFQVKLEQEDENSKPGSDPFLFFGASATSNDDKKSHHKIKHHSKHKKSRSKEQKHRRRSSETKERKRKIDSLCTLTESNLEKSGIRVITAMGGLFYAGRLSAIEPPDVYAVTLDGERGNRPHIMSREEILRDAIIEVAPQSTDEVPPGTRICAFWSQQYRCLYPGTVAEPGTPDSINDTKFVNVEFDDGDNGRIALEDIRYLLSDYPIVVYDPNPLMSLQKRKRRSSQGIHIDGYQTEGASSLVHQTHESEEDKIVDKEAQRERRRLKKMKKDKLKQQMSFESNPDLERKHKRKHKCGDELCKHRKHKKRRKHKKHHRENNEVSAEDEVSSEDVVPPEENTTSDVHPIVTADDPDEHFDPTIKDETMTEEDVASSVTESSESYYEPRKKKERQNSVENRSKIAAFLPARQLWAWSGKGFRRTAGRHKKTFFKMIQRGKETISVGDSAVFLSTGRPDRPYIGRIESMWETSVSNMVVRVKWFYHPEETEGCPDLKFPGALFESPHEDENDVQTISHKCEVLPLPSYTNKFGPDPKLYTSIYDNNDTYYLAGHYDPTAKQLKFQPDIPCTNEQTDDIDPKSSC